MISFGAWQHRVNAVPSPMHHVMGHLIPSMLAILRNNLTLLLIICSLYSCKYDEYKELDLNIDCIQTIIFDTMYSPKIAVICKFSNQSTFNVCIGNRYWQGSEDIPSSGLILLDVSNKDVKVNMGSILHSRYFVVPKGKSRHLIFTLTPLSGDSAMRNQYNFIQSHYAIDYVTDWPAQFLKNCKFKYHSEINEEILNDVSKEFNSMIFVDTILNVNRKDSFPKYLNNILFEDAGRMVMELDSLSDLK